VSNNTILGLSHINVVVDDIERATEFYGRTLGFEIGKNEGGLMDYPRVEMGSFARNAGFLSGEVEVHVRFLQHPVAKIYLELMRYQKPQGSTEITRKRTNDLGGPRHIALEVQDTNTMFEFLRKQPDVKMINQDPNYGPPETLESTNIKFFYWIDPWGVQWEMEEGRPIGEMKGISG